MKFISVTLILTLYAQTILSPKPESWFNFLPWSKEIPDNEYRKHININLVKKDWIPNVPKLPQDAEDILPEYPGDALDAYRALVNPDNEYKYNWKPLEEAKELLTGPYGYDPRLESIIISHTISGNAKNWMIKNLILSMAMRNMVKHYNIFAINMPGLEGSIERTVVKSFFGLKTNYIGIAKAIGGFLDSAIAEGLLSPDHINLVGFCWSAQLSGYIARYVKDVHKQTVRSIVALDPHSLGLSRLFHSVLTADDAQAVHAYHTNSLLFGTFRRQATVDFVFNSGLMQPGCYFTSNRMCSHRRAVTIMWYAILYPKRFVARKCSSWAAFKLCICKNEETTLLSFPPIPGNSSPGKFYMNTMSHKPYGYGDEGAECYVKHKDKDAVVIKDNNHLIKSNEPLEDELRGGF